MKALLRVVALLSFLLFIAGGVVALVVMVNNQECQP